MALERGEGVQRLAGMRERRDIEPGLVLLRPFLGLPKARLVASLRTRGLGWASDPTNSDPHYTRVRWRRHLAEASSAERHRLLRAIAEAAEARDAVDDAVARRLSEITVDARGLVAAPRALVAAPDAGGIALFSRILSAAGGSARPASGSSVLRLAERLAGGEGGFVATLGGCRLAAGRDDICVSREFGRVGPPTLDTAEGTCFDERFDLDPAEPRPDRIVALGALGRGGVLDAALPVAIDREGRPVAAHPAALRRLREPVRALRLTERVSWRLARDLQSAEPISQIAAKEPSQVGKDFPADYLPFRHMERMQADATARPVVAQSQDGR